VLRPESLRRGHPPASGVGTEGEQVRRWLRWEGSAMQYPHWLMVAGAALVVLGFIGLAVRQKRDVELDHERTDMKANGKRDGRDSNVTTLPAWPWRPPPQAR
jgi:hypothetical protein